MEGLRGGHSGLEIHENRTNAIKVMGELLSRVEKLMPLCLTKLTGGAKHNVIPNSCQATLVAMGIHLERINDIAQQLEQEIRQRYDEPDVKIYGDDVDALGGNALTTADTSKVIALLCASPHGVQSWSEDIPGLVQTSLNLAIVTLGRELQMVFSVRSSVNQQMYDLTDRLEDLARFNDAKVEHAGQYLAWEYQKNSVLRETMENVYQKMTGKAPEVVALHAGLECGLFCEKLPDLDCVAIGPNNHDVHTSKERLEIGSTLRTWEFLKEVLKAL